MKKTIISLVMFVCVFLFFQETRAGGISAQEGKENVFVAKNLIEKGTIEGKPIKEFYENEYLKEHNEKEKFYFIMQSTFSDGEYIYYLMEAKTRGFYIDNIIMKFKPIREEDGSKQIKELEYVDIHRGLSQLGHMNDVTYNENTNEAVVATAGYTGNMLQRIKVDTLFDKNKEPTITKQYLSCSVSAISYNSVTNQYVATRSGTGFEFLILNSDFQIEKVLDTKENGVSKQYPYGVQGSFCDEHYIYFTGYEEKTINGEKVEEDRLVILDWKGNILVNKKVPTNFDGKRDELENILIVDNQMLLGFYMSGNTWIQKCEPLAFYVTYKSNGGVGEMNDSNMIYGVSTALQKNRFTKEGYAFEGWNLYAPGWDKWYAENTGGERKWLPLSEIKNGWEKAIYKDQTSVKGTVGAGQRVEVNAVWRATDKFNIKYFPNGGTGTTNEQQITFGVTTSLNKNGFTRSGYTFEGWHAYRADINKWYYKDNDSDTRKWCQEGMEPKGYQKYVYKDQQNVSATGPAGEEIHMYAQWGTFTVYYNGNGDYSYKVGGREVMTPTKVKFGTATALQGVGSESGAKFLGWEVYRKSVNKWYYEGADGTRKWCEEGKEPTGYTKVLYKDKQSIAQTGGIGETIIMYAKWGHFTVKYHPNGGQPPSQSEKMVDQRIAFGTSTALAANIFSHPDKDTSVDPPKQLFHFQGWHVYRPDIHMWRYENPEGTEQRWCVPGKEPQGWKKAIYKDRQKIGKTASAGETAIMYAAWKKL